MAAHYQDQAALSAATDACLGAGMRVLQLFRNGDEAEHVSALLRMMDPPMDAVVVDVGCGVGEVARLMQEERSDLVFLLLNLSEYQLTMCPEQMERIRADMHAMPLAEESADVVMVNYTLGYADLPTLLAEAARVLRPDGVLFIYELTCADGNDATRNLMRAKFDYDLHSAHAIGIAAHGAGLALDRLLFIPASATHLAPLLDVEYRAVIEQLARGAQPTALRFTKGPQ